MYPYIVNEQNQCPAFPPVTMYPNTNHFRSIPAMVLAL